MDDQDLLEYTWGDLNRALYLFLGSHHPRHDWGTNAISNNRIYLTVILHDVHRLHGIFCWRQSQNIFSSTLTKVFRILPIQIDLMQTDASPGHRIKVVFSCWTCSCKGICIVKCQLEPEQIYNVPHLFETPDNQINKYYYSYYYYHYYYYSYLLIEIVILVELAYYII